MLLLIGLALFLHSRCFCLALKLQVYLIFNNVGCAIFYMVIIKYSTLFSMDNKVGHLDLVEWNGAMERQNETVEWTLVIV